MVGDWKTEILEYIDEDNLPEYYGGKCRDLDGDPLCRSRVHIFIFTSVLKDINNCFLGHLKSFNIHKKYKNNENLFCTQLYFFVN